MAWTYEIVRTRDGARQGRVYPVSTTPGPRRLDTKSSGNHTFVLSGNEQVWARMRPARRTLVACWDDQPWYAGVIHSAKYNKGTQTVELAHEDIWSVLERRMAIPRDPTYPAAATVTYSSLSRRTHAKRVVQMATTDPMEENALSYELPIILPSDESGNWTFTWRGYELHTAAAGLQRIGDPGGPMQVDFPLSWASDGSLRWNLQVSHSSSIETFIHADVPDTPVIDWSLDHDMSEYASELQVTGSGQDADTLQRFHWIGHIEGDFVALAADYSDGTIDTDDELQSVRDGIFPGYRQATVQLDVEVHLGEGGYSPHDFTLGQQVVFRTQDDPILPRGDIRTMLIGMSPSGPSAMRLELASIEGFTGYETEEPTLDYRNLRASKFSNITQRIHRAERRLVHPAGGSLAAATNTQEGI